MMQIVYRIALGIELVALVALLIVGALALDREMAREEMEEDKHGEA